MDTDKVSTVPGVLQGVSENLAGPLLDAGDGMTMQEMARGYTDVDARRLAARYLSLICCIMAHQFDDPQKPDTE